MTMERKLQTSADISRFLGAVKAKREGWLLEWLAYDEKLHQEDFPWTDLLSLYPAPLYSVDLDHGPVV